MQHVEVALPRNVDQVRGQPLRKRHHGQAADLRRVGEEHQRLAQRQLRLALGRAARAWRRLRRRRQRRGRRAHAARSRAVGGRGRQRRWRRGRRRHDHDGRLAAVDIGVEAVDDVVVQGQHERAKAQHDQHDGLQLLRI